MFKSRHIQRTWVFARAVALCLMLTVGTQASELEEQLRLCAERSADTARLACYDGLAESVSSKGAQALVETFDTSPVTASSDEAPTRTVTVDPSTGAPVKTPVAVAAAPDGDNARQGAEPTPTRNTESFGKKSDEKQSIRVMIEKTKRNARGDWYFYFDNGEVWKQIDTRNRHIPPLPAPAMISRGLFSSYKLHIDGEVWSMKIRRLK